jgi:hypothetical protein
MTVSSLKKICQHVNFVSKRGYNQQKREMVTGIATFFWHLGQIITMNVCNSNYELKSTSY